MRNSAELIIALKDELLIYLSNEKGAAFAQEFDELSAGKDLSDAWKQFAIWLLIDEQHGAIRFRNPYHGEYFMIKCVAQLYIDDCQDVDVWKAVWDAALDADYKLPAAAARAAWEPAYFDTTSAAVLSARAAWLVVRFAADEMNDGHLQTMADKLLELIKKSPEAT